jgi:carbamate kinase
MTRKQPGDVLLVALGGNALIRKGQTGTLAEQFANLKVPIRQIARLSRTYRILITHGNGPQVGHLMLQQECCRSLPRMPLEILVAQTQGQIGYMIESSLDAALMELGVHFKQRIVSLISYVVVSEADPAFADPTKPIGPVLTEAQAASAAYPVRKTAKGYRRVVVSPKPVTIVEKREIRTLLENDFIVVCCGGGGIPVVREGRSFAGVDAVIDKDLASARLAREVGVDIFLIATDVAGAALDFGTEKERFPRRMTVREAQRHLEAGQFPPGSMQPKIEAAVSFVRSGGRRAVIAGTADVAAAVAGEAGTVIVADR